MCPGYETKPFDGEALILELWGKVDPPFITITPYIYGGARGVIVIVVGNEHGDTSSNPGRD